MKIQDNILTTIGKTPIVRLNRINNTEAEILVKMESFNPGGSIKDRVALHMIEEAEKKGALKKGSIIVEATSGNTGIGLAMVCAVKGYKLMIVMPDSVNKERIQLVEAYGAEVVLTPSSLRMKGCLDKIEEIKEVHKDVFVPEQFKNEDNPIAHSLTTAKEIIEDLDGQLDMFISGTGTGGSFTGTARALKENIEGIKTYAMEPSNSPLLTKGHIGKHDIQGMGMSAGFIPPIFNIELADEVLTVSCEDAMKMTRRLAVEEGLLVGVSSGAAVCGALELANREGSKGKRILTLLMDTGERYLSCDIY